MIFMLILSPLRVIMIEPDNCGSFVAVRGNGCF